MKKMKFKVNLSGDNIKAMLAQHSEKAVFGLIILAALMLMHRGYQSRNPFDQERSPSVLKSQADQAKADMLKDTWSDVEDDSGNIVPGVVSERTKDLQLMERLQAGLTKIDLVGYPVEVPLSQLKIRPRTLRTDPELFTVIDLEVHAGNGPVAYGSSSGGGSGGSSGGGTVAADNRLNKAQQDAIPGFRPGTSAKARGCRFVAVLGKIPVQAQMNECDRCFRNSPEYDPSRDVPKHVYYYVQRTEVQPDGTDGEWVTLNTRSAQKEAGKWAGSPEEAVDAKFLDPVETMKLLPLMIRDSSAWRKHSWFPTAKVEDDGAQGTEHVEDASDGPGEDVPGDMPGDTPAESGGRPDHAAGSEAVATAEPADAPVEFKMFRFFDLTVRPGRSYRYKVQLMLEDPNDPRAEEQRVDSRFMDGSVTERLAGVTKGRHYRKSEWSEPSGPVQVPLDYHLLGGKVQAGRRIAISREASYQAEEPTGTVMTLLWDVALATDLPGEADVRRGSLLNYTTDVEVIDPVRLSLRTVPNYEFKTDTLVIDMAGGEKLPGRNSKDILYAPGEMLLMDSNGSLVMRDEMGDAPTFFSHKYSEVVAGAGPARRSSENGDRDSGGDKDDDVPPEGFFGTE